MKTMKNNTHIQNQQKKIFFSLIILLVTLNVNSVIAQVQNNGMLHISDNASFYVASGSFIFGTGSTTTTSRTASTYGKLSLASGVTVSGAATGAGLFTDGFVSTKSSSYFELPTGQTTTYAPIGITNAAVTNGVEAAYYLAAPTAVGINLFPTVSALQSVGYWVVKGDNATITMIWNSSIASLASSITDLTVAGYNTSTTKWEAIISGTPTGSTSSGTIATAAAVTLANYSAFTLAKKGIAVCAELVASSGNTKTWNGTSWTGGTPTLSDPAVLSVNYPSTAGSFVCNSLATGGNSITLIDGQTIEVVNGISGSGTINMSSTASILQRNDASIIEPQIALTKSTRSGMYANDYIYWGSPLKTDSFSQLSGARVYSNANELTGTTSAFDEMYKYVSGDTSTSGGWQTFSTTTPGVGFITKIKSQSPFSTASPSNSHINLTFSGATNNGTVSVPIVKTSINSKRDFNLISNPYPSAVDYDKFIEYNTNITGPIFVWNARTSNSGAVAYTAADYAAYTKAGSTANFAGKIATGQGFKVQALASGNVIFNNCMRISGNNTQFFRTSNTVIDRYKLNMTGINGVGNQILVAYMPEATLGYDRMYDAELFSVSPAKIYSLLDNTNMQLSINARPTFATTDVVTLGIDKSDTNAENFTIAIADKEGVFQANDINVVLHDKQLNVFHNLANGAYNFTTNSVQLTNRFEVVYQQTALGTTDFESNTVFATITNQTLKITASLPMTNIAIYDISGRLVTDFKVNSEKNAATAFLFADGIYIAKIKLNNGAIATQKLVNKK